MLHISRSRKHAAGPLIAVGPRWSSRVAMALAALGMLTLLAAAPAGAAAGPTSHSGTTSDGGSWVADVPAAGNGTLTPRSNALRALARPATRSTTRRRATGGRGPPLRRRRSTSLSLSNLLRQDQRERVRDLDDQRSGDAHRGQDVFCGAGDSVRHGGERVRPVLPAGGRADRAELAARHPEPDLRRRTDARRDRRVRLLHRALQPRPSVLPRRPRAGLQRPLVPPADSPEASSTSTTTCSITSTCATTPGIGSSTT